MRAALIAGAVMMAFSSTLVRAAEPAINLYLVPGIFFDDAGKEGRGSASKIHPSLLAALKKNIGQSVARLKGVSANLFTGLNSGIDAKNRHRTLALSVQVTRASRFEIDKQDGTRDVYLPITLSLYFSNPMTGEVLQSFSQTRVTTFSTTPDTLEAKVAQYSQQGFEKLLDEILGTASKQFSPYMVETRVRENWKGFAILDKGYGAGIGKGDILLDEDGNEIRIEHAGQDYSVAVPIMGKTSTGAHFSRPSMMKLADVKKPRVLALVSDGNNEMSDAVISQLFSDQLGADAPFSVLPLNANFGKVQAAIDSNTQIGSMVSNQRALPDYFIRLVVPDAAEYELPTNLGYKTLRHYKAWSFAELLSSNGRVLYAASGDEGVQDAVTSGVSFSAADRREVVLKNAIVELAERFAKEVRFKPQALNVVSADENQAWVSDPAASLQSGQSVRIYRDIGKGVLVPTWEARVESREGERIALKPVIEVAGTPPKVDRGDLVLVDQVGAPAAGNERLAYCPNSKSQVGQTSLTGYDRLAYAVAAQSGFNLVNTQLAALVGDKVKGATGFKSDLKLPPASYDLCLDSLYRIDPQDEPCNAEVCSSGFKVKAAFRQKQGETVARQMILEHGFKTSGYPLSTSAVQRQALQAVELQDDTRKLLKQVAQALREQK